jgi:hypothetical protein
VNAVQPAAGTPQAAIDAARLRMLEAMGVEVYALRVRASAPAASIAPGTAPRLAVVCARGVRAEARLACLFKHLPQTFAIAAEAIQWIEADANGELRAAPQAPACLVIGGAMARALGAQMSTAQQNSATIAVTAEPAQLPGSAADKRALWQALKPIARRLRAAAA